jgi:hypothetical protein
MRSLDDRVFINRNDLRIGNLVWLRGEVLYVRELMNEKLFLAQHSYNGHYDLAGTYSLYESLEPILLKEVLSEEFLAKIGFEVSEFTEEEIARFPSITKGNIDFSLQIEIEQPSNVEGPRAAISLSAS